MERIYIVFIVLVTQCLVEGTINTNDNSNVHNARDNHTDQTDPLTMVTNAPSPASNQNETTVGPGHTTKTYGKMSAHELTSWFTGAQSTFTTHIKQTPRTSPITQKPTTQATQDIPTTVGTGPYIDKGVTPFKDEQTTVGTGPYIDIAVTPFQGIQTTVGTGQHIEKRVTPFLDVETTVSKGPYINKGVTPFQDVQTTVRTGPYIDKGVTHTSRSRLSELLVSGVGTTPVVITTGVQSLSQTTIQDIPTSPGASSSEGSLITGNTKTPKTSSDVSVGRTTEEIITTPIKDKTTRPEETITPVKITTTTTVPATKMDIVKQNNGLDKTEIKPHIGNSITESSVTTKTVLKLQEPTITTTTGVTKPQDTGTPTESVTETQADLRTAGGDGADNGETITVPSEEGGNVELPSKVKERQELRRVRLQQMIKVIGDSKQFNISQIEHLDPDVFPPSDLAKFLNSINKKINLTDKDRNLASEDLGNVEVISMDKLVVVVCTISAALILFIVIMCIINCRKGKPELQSESMKSDFLQLSRKSSKAESVTASISNGKVNSESFMGIPPNNDIWRELQKLPEASSSVTSDHKEVEISKF